MDDALIKRLLDAASDAVIWSRPRSQGPASAYIVAHAKFVALRDAVRACRQPHSTETDEHGDARRRDS